MKLSVPNCPECGGRAVSIDETLLATAWLSEPDDDGHIDYLGESQIGWDTQEPVLDASGKTTVSCDKRHSWQTEIAES